MQGQYVTAQGEKHGLIRKDAASVKGKGFEGMKGESKEKALKQKAEDTRMVKVRYLNHDDENGRLDHKAYHRWHGEPTLIYTFINGYEYEVPMGLVNEINESGMPRRSEILDVNGVPTKKDGPKKRIHEMVPVTF